MDILVGCDPELFVKSRATGLPVSAFGLVPGTKREPFEVDDGAVQVDGMALEFNTKPAATFDQFDHNITSVLGAMRSMVSDDLVFDIRASVVFDDTVLAAMPEEALVLGCDPDYNAYTMKANPRPEPPLPGLRTASGHIHVGLPGEIDDWRSMEHFEDMARLCRAMDRFCGLTSVIIDPDPTRRVLYGAAGAMRVKPYGMEYRVPSNGWIKTRRKRALMFEMVQRSIAWLIEDDVTRNVVDDDVQTAINTSNVAECKAILNFMMGGTRG